MAQSFVAAPRSRGYVPAFTVEKLDGSYDFKKASRDKKDYGLRIEDANGDRGWLVTFPRGHSIHVATMVEMKRMGFDQTSVPLVDEEGDVVGAIPNDISKKKVREHA